MRFEDSRPTAGDFEQGLCTRCAGPADILPRIREPTSHEDSMGKGDTRTRRGKIYNGSYGKKRPGKVKKPTDGAGAPSPAPARPGRVR